MSRRHLSRNEFAPNLWCIMCILYPVKHSFLCSVICGRSFFEGSSFHRANIQSESTSREWKVVRLIKSTVQDVLITKRTDPDQKFQTSLRRVWEFKKKKKQDLEFFFFFFFERESQNIWKLEITHIFLPARNLFIKGPGQFETFKKSFFFLFCFK